MRGRIRMNAFTRASVSRTPRSGSRWREVAWVFRRLLRGRFPGWPSVLSSSATRRRRTSPVARSTIDPRDAITRKTAALELVHDEGVESFFVQWRRPLGVAASLNARFTRSWCPEAPTRKAEVQAGYAAT